MKGFSPRYESAAKRGLLDLAILKVPRSSHLRLLANDIFGSTRGSSARVLIGVDVSSSDFASVPGFLRESTIGLALIG